VTDADCKGNPVAYGGVCTKIHWCECFDDADCENLDKGPQCFGENPAGWDEPIGGICGCASDSDCELDGAECLPYPGTVVKFCRVPCSDDGSCVGEPFSKVCEPVYEMCVPCVVAGDCKALSPVFGICWNNGCYHCFEDSDCVLNPWALGPKCEYWDTGPPSCACFADADCQGNPNGPVCLDTACGCTSADQCAPGQVCAPLIFTTFGTPMTCQEAEAAPGQ
jgi:hypothetical protein